MSEPTIDPTTFAALQDMAGPEFADELIDTFFEEAPVILTEIKAALVAGDADSYRRAAHSLKSNGTTFGASKLSAMSKAMELGGIDASSPAAVEALTAEYAVVAAALKDLRHG